jgi:hypothetical protein
MGSWGNRANKETLPDPLFKGIHRQIVKFKSAALNTILVYFLEDDDHHSAMRQLPAASMYLLLP